MVLLIGSYPPDQWQSMLRFSQMMLDGLRNAGIDARLIQPPAFLGRIRLFGATAAKWLGYIDKFVFFQWPLRRSLAARPSLVHICDHSDATHARAAARFPLVITCHDLFAVRGALGENPEHKPGFTGRILQGWILRGLRRANLIACISSVTAQDVKRLVVRGDTRPRVAVVPLGLNYPFRKLAPAEARERLAKVQDVDLSVPFVLHVGTNTPRKNRGGVLRIFARTKNKWNGRLVFVGELLNTELVTLARKLDVFDRIAQIENADSDILEALYSSAVALVYPSRFEGFGWPVIEAHACGCPVTCSNSGPLPEVAGAAGIFHDLDDEAGFAEDLLRLNDPEERARWSAKALENAERFSATRMIAQYRELYRALVPTLERC
ncbi:MAG TPA: glycosyltransferase family 1 protein [Chthoniobacterales bacterium]|jgi:glycosyltransferase involved in cell wall biosynthesis